MITNLTALGARDPRLSGQEPGHAKAIGPEQNDFVSQAHALLGRETAPSLETVTCESCMRSFQGP